MALNKLHQSIMQGLRGSKGQDSHDVMLKILDLVMEQLAQDFQTEFARAAKPGAQADETLRNLWKGIKGNWSGQPKPLPSNEDGGGFF